jgi:hypothetical protein
MMEIPLEEFEHLHAEIRELRAAHHCHCDADIIANRDAEIARLRAALTEIGLKADQMFDAYGGGDEFIYLHNLAASALGAQPQVARDHEYRADCFCDACETKRWERIEGETRREYKLRTGRNP